MFPIFATIGVLVMSALDLGKTNVAGCHGGVIDFNGMAITASPNHYLAPFLPGFSMAPKATFVTKSLLLTLPEPTMCVCSPYTKGYPFLSTVVSTMDDAPAPVTSSSNAPNLFASAWIFAAVDSLVDAINDAWEFATWSSDAFYYYVICVFWYLFFGIIVGRSYMMGLKRYGRTLGLKILHSYTTTRGGRTGIYGRPSLTSYLDDESDESDDVLLTRQLLATKIKRVLTYTVDIADLVPVTFLVQLLRCSEGAMKAYCKNKDDRVKLAESIVHHGMALLGDKFNCNGTSMAELALELDDEELDIFKLLTARQTVGYTWGILSDYIFAKTTAYLQKRALETAHISVGLYLSSPNPLRKIAFLLRTIFVLHAAATEGLVKEVHIDHLNSLITDVEREYGDDNLVLTPLKNLLEELEAKKEGGNPRFKMKAAKASFEIILMWVSMNLAAKENEKEEEKEKEESSTTDMPVAA